ncbi:MAG TPA: sigma-70 family RNA polymerase sigma factor [Acidimicrobiales bacterium]
MEARQAATVLPVSLARTDRDEFARAVDLHHRALTRFAYMLCGNQAQAEDAVAEAYARVWRRWRRGRIDNLFGYLRRAVANEVYGRHRRWLLERREAERAPERIPDGQFEAQVTEHDALWTALGRLSPQLRVVVVLRVVEDMSEADTAAMLGVPAGTVKSRLSRGLAILRAAVGDDGVADGGAADGVADGADGHRATPSDRKHDDG